MAALTTTNPYYSYHATNTREYSALTTAAITKFEPERIFKINSSDASDFATEIESKAQQFGYIGETARVATTCVFDEDSPNTFTYGNRKDIIGTWNTITEDHIQRNATMLFGNRTFTVTSDDGKDLATPTIARGEITPGGNALTALGKQIMHRRFLSSIMAGQCLALIGEDGRKALKVHRKKYEWWNPLTGELINDGLMILFLILKKMRPSVMVSTVKEINKMKTIQPEQFAYNITEWDTAMESARINIELKAPGQYSMQQYTQDYLDAALLTPCKSFKREVSSYRTKWMLGGEVHLTIDYLRDNITQMYVNFEDDETWKHEIAESSQVIALATQMQKLQNDMKSTIALATAASAAKSSTPNNDAAPNHRGKRQPYTVKEWRLKFDGEEKEVDGKTWYWCKSDHYSGGKVHNGMYATHKTCDHDKWRKEQDERNAQKYSGKRTGTPSASDSEPAAKKLALSDKLRTALTTKAGLSNEMYDSIWNEANGDSGNA